MFLFSEQSSKFLSSEKALSCLTLACKFKGFPLSEKDIEIYFTFNSVNSLIIQKEIVMMMSSLVTHELRSLKRKFKNDDKLEKRFKKRFLGMNDKEIAQVKKSKLESVERKFLKEKIREK